MSRMEMRCGTTKCERCGKESVITIRHKLYDAQFCVDCYNDANDNKELFLTSVELAPVIHAHWEYRYDTGIYQTEFLCSRCKGLIETYSCTVDEVEYEYCPHCGAKMDEVVEE